MLDLLPAVGLAIGGLFLAVVLGGALSGLLAFGIIDRFARRRVQRAIIRAQIESPLLYAKKSNPEVVIDFLIKRCGTRHRAIAYCEWLETTLKWDGLVGLVGLNYQSFYALHYPQLCGQIVSHLNAEASTRSDEKRGRTPLTDVLAAVSLLRERDEREANFGPPRRWAAPTMARNRAALDLALREVDALQISLAEGLGRVAFRTSAAITTSVFIAIIGGMIPYLNLSGPGSPFLVGAAGAAASLIAALIVAVGLIIASSVLSALVFQWLDRMTAVR